MDFDVFDFELKGEAPFDEVSGVEDFKAIRGFLQSNKRASLGNQGPDSNFHIPKPMSLTDNPHSPHECKLVQKTLHRNIAQGKDLKVFGLPVGVAMLVGIKGLQ